MRYFAEHGNWNRIIDALTCEQYMKDNMEDPGPQICSRFGCGRQLTITEKLYSTRCQEHNIKQIIDVTKYIQL